MSEDWTGGDPFADPSDPAAAEREKRRQEREERRRKRDAKRVEKEAAAPPPPEPAPPPPQAPRSVEEDFWEEPAAEASPPSPPPGGGGGGPRRSGPGVMARLCRHRLGVAVGLAAILLGAAARAVAAYRHFNSDPPPPVVIKTITTTIPEGLTRAQTAEQVKAEGVTGSYEKASVRSRYLNPASYGGKGAKSLEGFLFPDTFELEKGAPATDLVQLQLQDFKRRIKGVNMRYARSKNLTTFDVITIASMIEREAQVARERKLVAAVIYNRLRQGMPLGIDATVRFATGNHTEPLTESELNTDSPYNTRVNAGLPPGPINSPGLASIEAAAHPAKVDYLFYVVKPGTCGEHSFSSSEAQFQADVKRYDDARAAAGGESPDSC